MIKINSKAKDYTRSQWRRHREGKEPIVAEIVEKDDSVRFLGFTKLQAHSIKLILNILRSEGIVPRIFYSPKGYEYRIIISVKPVSACVAKRYCKYVLSEIRKQGVTLSSVDYFPRYSNRNSALKNRIHTSNELRLPMYAGELILGTLPPADVQEVYGKWLLGHLAKDIDIVPNVLNDLSRCKEMFENQDEALARKLIINSQAF